MATTLWRTPAFQSQTPYGSMGRKMQQEGPLIRPISDRIRVNLHLLEINFGYFAKSGPVPVVFVPELAAIMIINGDPESPIFAE